MTLGGRVSLICRKIFKRQFLERKKIEFSFFSTGIGTNIIDFRHCGGKKRAEIIEVNVRMFYSWPEYFRATSP